MAAKKLAAIKVTLAGLEDGALCVAPVALGLLADLAGSTAAPFAVCSLATAGAVGFLGTRAGDLPRPNVKS